MNIVGRIAKDIFTSYGETLTETKQALLYNSKKILCWSIRSAAVGAAVYFGGLPVMAGLASGLVILGGYKMMREPRYKIGGLSLLASGYLAFAATVLNVDTPSFLQIPSRSLLSRNTATKDVEHALQAGRKDVTVFWNDKNLFRFGRFGLFDVSGMAHGEQICRNSADTALSIQVNGIKGYYTRLDSKSKWEPVSSNEFSQALGCGSGK